MCEGEDEPTHSFTSHEGSAALPADRKSARPILGRLSKRGSKYLRSLFIQAANVILMRPKTWEKFSFGAWLTAASARMHRNKLAAALANKLARIAWSVLRHNKRFDEALAI
jgi:transposase